jgi:prepilin-type processing-associated H-X9-DG protein
MSAFASILDQNILGTSAGVQHNSLLRHGGHFNIVYLDGHAKNTPFKGGTLQNPLGGQQGQPPVVYVGVPQNDTQRLMYCLTSDAPVNISALTGGQGNYPSTLPCNQAIFLPEQFGIQWWPN